MYYQLGLVIARARWAVLAVWAVLLLGALLVAPRVFGVLEPGGFSSSDLESQRTSDLLTDRFGYCPGTLIVLFTAPAGSELHNSDPRFLADMDHALVQVRDLPDVAFVVTPRENPRQASADGTTAYAAVALRVGPEAFRTVLP